MGKSKYQSRVNTRLNENPQGRTVYYDEKIKPMKEGFQISTGLYAIIVIGIVLGAGVVIGVTFFGSDIIENIGGSTNNGNGDDTSLIFIESGDSFKAIYTLWAADVAGEEGVINYDVARDQSTTGVDFNTENVIAGFKANILGMVVGEEKTFSLAPGQGYTSGELAYKKLVFYVKIVSIAKL